MKMKEVTIRKTCPVFRKSFASFLFLSIFLVPIHGQSTSISAGGFLNTLGQLLTQDYTVDTNTFLTGAIAATAMMIKAPILLLLQVLGKVVSIVALSFFISYLGDELGVDIPVPFGSSAFQDEFNDDQLLSDSLFDDNSIDTTLFVRLNPNSNRRQNSNFIRKLKRRRQGRTFNPNELINDSMNSSKLVKNKNDTRHGVTNSKLLSNSSKENQINY